MTVFIPGHNPPQVTIHAFTSFGSKNKNFLGPALRSFIALSSFNVGPNVADAESNKQDESSGLTNKGITENIGVSSNES